MRVLVDRRIALEALSSLISHDFEPILMPPDPILQSGVASHTDMLVFIGFGGLFCHASYFASNTELIEDIARNSGLELHVSNEKIGKDYPSDVLFNACLLGNKLICNTRTVSQLILDAARSCGCEIIHSQQGYTKCSVCPVGDNAIITADRSIAKACAEKGIDVLTVSEGNISLPPYSYGFIGGTSGCSGDNVYFCGSIETHPDGDRIKESCRYHGKSAISLSSGVLQDLGSLYFIN